VANHCTYPLPYLPEIFAIYLHSWSLFEIRTEIWKPPNSFSQHDYFSTISHSLHLNVLFKPHKHVHYRSENAECRDNNNTKKGYVCYKQRNNPQFCIFTSKEVKVSNLLVQKLQPKI
jgi:hypothetical protein